MRLAYADPPYPGKAHLYPENTEVDHAELIARLCDYDGWALSTDEVNLAGVLALCPPRTRVLAWCKSNAPPFGGVPWQAWEPVLLQPARSVASDPVRSFLVSGAPTGHAQVDGLTGQKTEAFCLWIIRALAAETTDTLDDLYPGTGVMGRTWESYRVQPRLFDWVPENSRSYAARSNLMRRIADPLEGLPAGEYQRERRCV